MPNLALVLGNMGSLYVSMQGYHEAEEKLKESRDYLLQLSKRNP